MSSSNTPTTAEIDCECMVCDFAIEREARTGQVSGAAFPITTPTASAATEIATW
jgi:hypothetical protein